jgi:transposase
MHQARHDADSYRRVEVITGGRRRRDWSEEEKARIVAESADPDANISEVARRNGVSRKRRYFPIDFLGSCGFSVVRFF